MKDRCCDSVVLLVCVYVCLAAWYIEHYGVYIMCASVLDIFNFIVYAIANYYETALLRVEPSTMKRSRMNSS